MSVRDESENIHPTKHVREYVTIFEFASPVNEEFTLTPKFTIKKLDLTVIRSTKIKIEVAEREVDILHSSFGMSLGEVKKAEKEELNVPDSDFIQVNPNLILKSSVLDSDLWYLNLLAFSFKNDKLISVTAIDQSGKDLTMLNDLARGYGYESNLSGSNPVKWQKNGLQFTAQMKEVQIGKTEKRTAPCLIIEKIL